MKEGNFMGGVHRRQRNFLLSLGACLCLCSLSFFYLGGFNASSLGSEEEFLHIENKHKGAHVFGIQDTCAFLRENPFHLDWVTLVSWGFQEAFDSPSVSHGGGDSIRVLKHNEYWVDKIDMVQSYGFKVLFKPHLWIHDESSGKWRSDIFPKDDRAWEKWKASYREFILRYAGVAEEAGADMYCVGVEFTRLALEKPEFWRSLIREVRSTYSGKLIYAANWYHEYEHISFWEDLDYIGVQAYFPISDHLEPSIEEAERGWKNHIRSLEKVAKENQRPIIFTEMGYKSTADSAIKPWLWAEDPANSNAVLSNETQANCYQAFYNTVWDAPWFGGVHLWQLRSDYGNIKREVMLDFTPQGKLAAGIISKYNGQEKS